MAYHNHILYIWMQHTWSVWPSVNRNSTTLLPSLMSKRFMSLARIRMYLCLKCICIHMPTPWLLDWKRLFCLVRPSKAHSQVWATFSSELASHHAPWRILATLRNLSASKIYHYKYLYMTMIGHQYSVRENNQ